MNEKARAERFTFRLTHKEKRALKIMATRENLLPGEFIRMLIREGAERRGIKSIGLIEFLYGGEKYGQ